MDSFKLNGSTLLGVSGHIAGYDVFIHGATIVIHEDKRGGRSWTHTVPEYGTKFSEFSRRSGFRLGWGRFPDGAEVIQFYDKNDDNFGYAYNLTYPDCSEWGYC